MDEKITFLDLGRQPMANGFLDNKGDEEFFYNLVVNFNPKNYLVSLDKFVEPSKMFNGTYHYVSSGSMTMRTHFKNVAEHINRQFSPKKILEIGSNDGVFIKNFPAENTISVEPCSNFADMTNANGYKTYCSFWNNDTAKIIVNEQGPVDVIFSANCISHMQNLTDTFLATQTALADDCVLIMEDPSILEVIKNGSYDQIYDEHAYVFSTIALDKVLREIGMRIFKVERLPIHGGSRRVYADKFVRPIDQSVDFEIANEMFFDLDKPTVYFQFAHRVEQSKRKLRETLINLKEAGNKIISYGATGKSTTIFNYCDLGPEIFSYITDITPDKQGKFSPGMHIPIVSPKDGFPADVDVAFLGAWNFEKEILGKETSYTGKWISHVPFVRTITNVS